MSLSVALILDHVHNTLCACVGGHPEGLEDKARAELQPSGELILVVVASIQMRTLKTEVGKGSMPTVIGHGLVSPKESGNSIIKWWLVRFVLL
jgi:hypothetical protein